MRTYDTVPYYMHNRQHAAAVWCSLTSTAHNALNGMESTWEQEYATPYFGVCHGRISSASSCSPVVLMPAWWTAEPKPPNGNERVDCVMPGYNGKNRLPWISKGPALGKEMRCFPHHEKLGLSAGSNALQNVRERTGLQCLAGEGQVTMVMK